MRARIPIDRERVTDFCQRHHVRKLSLFGSVLRDDFRVDSDVDVLIEFDPSHIPGFLRLGQMERELSSILGSRRLDVLTPKSLHPAILDRVLSDAEVHFDGG